MVPPAGIEPALGYPKQILSLQRLPIPPRGHAISGNVWGSELQGLRAGGGHYFTAKACNHGFDLDARGFIHGFIRRAKH